MTETRDLLFELGTEELPPKSLFQLSQALKSGVETCFPLATGVDGVGEVIVFATPRRLAVLVKEVIVNQQGVTIERRGPALSAAYTADGAPTKALQGFMKSCGASQEKLKTVSTEKGAWIAFDEHRKGSPMKNLIPDLFEGILKGLPIAKRMRWGNGTAEFVRPVHWVVLLFGD